MIKTYDEIFGELSLAYSGGTGLALREGSDMEIRMKALAAQIYSLWVQVDWVRRQSFPQTACGQYLDYHAQMRRLSRADAQKASGKISFYLSDALEADVSIPGGVVCSTVSGVNFVTVSDGVISAGKIECTVNAVASDAGSHGNVPAGSILYMTSAPTGVAACVNNAVFSGGIDTEGDDSLRSRILATYATLPNGTNSAYYEKLLLEYDGVAAAKVLPRKRGLGTVDIIFSTLAGLPSSELIAEVSDMLEAQREICVDIMVYAPETVTVSPDIALSVKDGYTFFDVSEAVRQAVTAYFDGKLLGTDVLLAKLGNIVYSAPGVRNYRISSPASDVAISPSQLPQLGVLTLSQMGE